MSSPEKRLAPQKMTKSSLLDHRFVFITSYKRTINLSKLRSEQERTNTLSKENHGKQTRNKGKGKSNNQIPKHRPLNQLPIADITTISTKE
jgi:hypothetical protein